MKYQFVILTALVLAAMGVCEQAEARFNGCKNVPGNIVYIASKELMNCAGLGSSGLSIREGLPYKALWRGLFTCAREEAGSKFHAIGYDVSYRWSAYEATGGEASDQIEDYGDLGCLFMSKATKR